ncbi:hypothetical protein Dimus_025747 [Dionaea muscipula]
MGIGCFSKGSKGKRDVECHSRGDLQVLDNAIGGDKLSPEHLVVMVNGLAGSATDWKFAAEQFVKRLPETVIVHRGK